MSLLAGVARTVLTPFWGVELAGWGYYIERRWRRVHDDLHATALVVDDGQRCVVIITLDLMLVDNRFTAQTRRRIHEATEIPPECILIACSHSHNAPAAGGLRGVGETDPCYAEWASRQAATAAVLAFNRREPVQLSSAHTEVEGVSFNRTREQGRVDTRLTTLSVERLDGRPLAIVVNYQAHPTVCTELRPWDVSRDVPGEVCDQLESRLPGVTALFLQGACGDTNFLPELSTAERCHEPARKIADAALACQGQARRMENPHVAGCAEQILLPTRRWTQEEIESDRCEAERRLASKDTTGWRETIGRAMTNRPEDMIQRHGGDELKAVLAMARFHMEWTEEALKDWMTRPETLETEVQCLRIGDVYISANASELFGGFADDVRRRADVPELMLACYANGRIGYLPDAQDIGAKTYAAIQSPKYCNQFPFTAASGPMMCDAMVRLVGSLGG